MPSEPIAAAIPPGPPRGGVKDSNLLAAIAGWGQDMPPWVRLLASTCDTASQRAVGQRLGKSSGYISRILSNTYTGNMDEAERLVRSTFGAEDVHCPVWTDSIPLASCMSNRRRKRPAQNSAQRAYARICPGCSNNTDGAVSSHEEERDAA